MQHPPSKPSPSRSLAVGVDVGGSSIKCALVDLESGEFVGERLSVPTPAKDSTETLLAAISDVVKKIPGEHAVGLAFPSVITRGTVRTAAHLNKDWIGQPLAALATRHLSRTVVAINDADAAGLAELHHGAAKDVAGTVLLLTLGTGIGSALFIDGHLVPNTELGHLQVAGREAELRAAGRIKTELNLSWDAWAGELNAVLHELHSLLWPDLIVLCGGITEEPEQFMDKLHCDAPSAQSARCAREAGIVGAALATTALARRDQDGSPRDLCVCLSACACARDATEPCPERAAARLRAADRACSRDRGTGTAQRREGRAERFPCSVNPTASAAPSPAASTAAAWSLTRPRTPASRAAHCAGTATRGYRGRARRAAAGRSRVHAPGSQRSARRHRDRSRSISCTRLLRRPRAHRLARCAPLCERISIREAARDLPLNERGAARAWYHSAPYDPKAIEDSVPMKLFYLSRCLLALAPYRAARSRRCPYTMERVDTKTKKTETRFGLSGDELQGRRARAAIR